MTFRSMMLGSTLLVSMAGAASAQETRYAFDDLDTDADGMVTLAELEAGFDSVGSDASPEAVLDLQDNNGDGAISRDEAGADMAIYTLAPEDEAAEED